MGLDQLNIFWRRGMTVRTQEIGNHRRPDSLSITHAGMALQRDRFYHD